MQYNIFSRSSWLFRSPSPYGRERDRDRDRERDRGRNREREKGLNAVEFLFTLPSWDTRSTNSSKATHTVDAHTAEVSVLDFSHLFSVKCDEWRKNSSGCGRRSMLIKICLNIFSSFFAIIISSDLLSIILFFCRWTAYHLTHTVSSFLQQDLQIR